MFNEDASQIKKRMLDRITTSVDKSEGSFVNDSVSASSEEFARQSANLDELLLRGFANTAFENGFYEDLVKRCNDFGVFQKQGTYAKGHAIFYGAENTLVTSGTLVQTSSDLVYESTSDGTIINGSVVLAIQALEIGSKYNVPSGSVNKLSLSLPGITAVNNLDPITGGTDIESYENLYIRLQTKVTAPSTSGNKYDYLNWSLEIDGVGGAKVFPLWAGNNTVKVILVDSNKEPAEGNLVSTVYENIETKRPIGALVTVEPAVSKMISLTVTIIKSELIMVESIINNITSKIKKYFQEIAFKERYVSHALIGANILSVEGVIDYNGLLVNGQSGNVELSDLEVAVLEEVIIDVA